MNQLSAADIVAAYQDATAAGETASQDWLRLVFPKLKLEFDAIDYIADRKRRQEAKRGIA